MLVRVKGVLLVGLILRAAGLVSEGPEFKSCLAVELISGGVDSACHPTEFPLSSHSACHPIPLSHPTETQPVIPLRNNKMSSSLLGWLSHLSVLCQSGDLSRIVPNSQGDCFCSTNALCRVWSQMEWNGWQVVQYRPLMKVYWRGDSAAQEFEDPSCKA